jgi:hypothetical protein
MARRRDIEQHAVAIAIEHCRTIACGANDDGTLGSAAGRQVVGAIESVPMPLP